MKRQIPDGCKVKVFHYREHIGFNGRGMSRIYNEAPAPCGGQTIVHIIKDDAIIAEGEAVCSPHESYNKRLGYQIALGRALSELDGTQNARRARLEDRRKQRAKLEMELKRVTNALTLLGE